MSAVFSLDSAQIALAGELVLREVDLRIDEGEFVVVLGGNGSGKTTLIRTLLGLLPLHGGELRIFGEAPNRFHDWARIGYVPQRFTAAAGVPATVEEVVLSGRIARAKRVVPWRDVDKRAAQDALEMVGLGDKSAFSAGALSGGQQQRVLIARALATDPDVLVLDEPVSGVDLEHQEIFAEVLRAMSERGKTVLLVAHSLGVLAPLAQRTVVLEGGRVAYDGPPLPQHAQPDHAHHHPAQEPLR